MMVSTRAVYLGDETPEISWLDRKRYALSQWEPCYQFVRRHLRMDRDDDLDALDWMSATIEWDKMHPVKYRLWRIYIVGSHPIQLFKDQITRPLRRFWQRGRQGWCYEDIWSMDGYLCRIIPEMLDDLRRQNHGWPGPPLTFEDWNDDGGILDQVANGFRAHLANSNMDYIGDDERYDHDRHWPISEGLQLQFEEGAALFIQWYGHLWD